MQLQLTNHLTRKTKRQTRRSCSVCLHLCLRFVFQLLFSSPTTTAHAALLKYEVIGSLLRTTKCTQRTWLTRWPAGKVRQHRNKKCTSSVRHFVYSGEYEHTLLRTLFEWRDPPSNILSNYTSCSGAGFSSASWKRDSPDQSLGNQPFAGTRLMSCFD